MVDGSAMTESGRQALAAVFGDTGELDREIDAALGRLEANDDEELDAALRCLEERGDEAAAVELEFDDGAEDSRLHASAIVSRIQRLADEAYREEEQRKRELLETSGKHLALAAAPALPLEAAAVEALPWELRRHLTGQQQGPSFLVGAAIGAGIAILASGVTFAGVYTWTRGQQAQGDSAPAPVIAGPPSALVGPQGPGAADSAPPAAPKADPGRAASPVPPGSSAIASSAKLERKLPPTSTSSSTSKVASALKPKAPRAAKPVALAPAPREEEVVMDEADTTEEQVASPAEEEDPVPSEDEFGDDAFEREFGDGAPKDSPATEAPAPAAGGKAPAVFVPPAPGQLPETLSELQVLEGVVAHKEEIATCVTDHAGDSEERRTLVMAWTIAPDGKVKDARVESAADRGQPLGDCVKAAISGWSFAPHRDPQPVRFPFAY